MSVQTYDELVLHFGHPLDIAIYGEGLNAAIECTDCNEVLLDFDSTDKEKGI